VLGWGWGRVVIYLPMIPEAVIAMLACARLGAVHSVVFGGFAAHELAVRIDDARPRLIISASCGIEVAGSSSTSRSSTRRSTRRSLRPVLRG
jgi:acyl-coenzyme A synthetase/AMP-(fatty) acid ligase